MTAALVLTAAGRAAVADNANVGMNAIQLRQIAIGSGLRPMGADDDARAALRNSRDVNAVAGSDATPGHIAFRADFNPSGNYSVTEVGLFARIGDAGAQFLFAYWAVEDAADAVAAALTGTALVVAGVIAIQSSEADIDITPAVNVSVGGVSPPDASLTTKGLVELATVAETRAGASQGLAVTPRGVDARIDDLVGTATGAGNTLGKLQDLVEANDGDIAGLVAMLNALAARVATVEDRPVGNETLIYESQNGVALGNGDTAFALTADLSDFDAVYVLYAEISNTINHWKRTMPAPVHGIPDSTATTTALTNPGDDASPFTRLHSTGVRNLTFRKAITAAKVLSIVGIKYGRP